MKNKHLYKKGAKRGELRSFEHKYGSGPGYLKSGKYVPNKGAAIYGATVGKVKRERMGGGKY